MTNEERDIITQFIGRVAGAPAASGFTGSASVPATKSTPLPPVDQEANALILQMFQRYPEAAYRLTQLAFVQEQALIQAQNRIQQVEANLALARQAAPAQQQGGGFFSNLFGGNRQQNSPPPNQGPWGGHQGAPGYVPPPPYAPPPQYGSGYQPGMFQRGGSGFLGSALTTAAGVAGGMVVGNMLTNMFSGGQHMGGFLGDQSGGGGGAWGSPTPSVTDQGAWDNGGVAAAPSSQDYVDNASWDQQPAPDTSSWTDSSGESSGGGWDSGAGGGGSDDTF